MNLALSDPFVLSQDYPESTTASLRSGHSTIIRFNRQGDLLASGRADGVVVIFDVETTGVARKLKGHTRQIQSLSWSRDGRYLLTCSQDWSCLIWDLLEGTILRTVRFEAAVYIAEFHPDDHLKFVASLFDDEPLFVDATSDMIRKYPLPSKPKRPLENGYTAEEQDLADSKNTTTVTVFSPHGKFIIAGTSKGWLNVIDTDTQICVYSLKVCAGVVLYMRLSASGRDIVINASDRIVRTMILPNLAAEDLDVDTIDIQAEHKFQDVVNKLSWNHVAFSANGDYVTATTYNNHDIYIWERQHGSLVKILEGPKEEHGTVEWHPNRPLIAACGLESGRVNIWSIVPQQRWSALAPDFVEVEENVEYEEHEDEFDIHPQEEIHKRRLDLEDEDVDVLTIEPIKGGHTDTVNPFKMPVKLDYVDSESEEEFVSIGRGEMRRKSPTEARKIHIENGDGTQSAAEDSAADGSRRRNGRS